MVGGTPNSRAIRSTVSCGGGTAIVHRYFRLMGSTATPETGWPDGGGGDSQVARVCKPNSVCSLRRGGGKRQPFLLAADCSAAPATYPEGSPGQPGERRAASTFHAWSCSRWGLSCPRRCRRGGELLPRRCTRSPRRIPRTRRGASVGWFVFCDTFRPPVLAFRGPPFFTGHPALWSSDFPHPIPSEGNGTRLPDKSEAKRS